MKPKIVAVLIAAALVVGGGAFALTRFMAPAEDSAIEFVPKDAVGYFNVFIRPSNSQKQALDDLLQKFPGIDSTDEAIRKITDLLDDALSEGGMDYQEDVEPWLGDQIAGFLTTGGDVDNPDFSFLIESKDDAAAQDFVEKLAEEDGVVLEDKTYEGETYQMEEGGDEDFAVSIVDGYLVAGTEASLKDVIDTRAGGETLEAQERFTQATGPLTDDWIGLFYVDTAAFIEQFGAGEDLGAQEEAALEALGFDEQQPQAGILYVTSSSVAFETTGGFSPGTQFGDITEAVTGAGIVPELPGETWAAFGVPSVGDFFTGLFDMFSDLPGGVEREQIDAMFYGQTGLRLEEDLLSWMGDFGLFVQGTSIREIGGGFVIESDDPGKTVRLLEKLEEVVAQQGIATQPEELAGLEGFSVQIPGVPAPVYALGGERLVVAYGEEAATAAAGEGATLEESEHFAAAQDAVGEDFNISFYLDVDAAQRFGEAAAGFAGAPMDVYEEDVKPYVDVLTHVVGAAKSEGDTIVQKLVIGVE